MIEMAMETAATAAVEAIAKEGKWRITLDRSRVLGIDIRNLFEMRGWS